jgi:hypothetical protein
MPIHRCTTLCFGRVFDCPPCDAASDMPGSGLADHMESDQLGVRQRGQALYGSRTTNSLLVCGDM